MFRARQPIRSGPVSIYPQFPDSFLTSFSGVLPQLYSPGAWLFHKEILGKCNMILCPFVVLITLADGGVAKIKSFLGVRLSLSLSLSPLSRYSCLWNRKTSSSSPTLKLCTNSLSKFVSRQLFLSISSMALPGSAHSWRGPFFRIVSGLRCSRRTIESNLWQGQPYGLRTRSLQQFRYVAHKLPATYVVINLNLGEEHKRQRKLLNPMFTVAHVRGMRKLPIKCPFIPEFLRITSANFLWDHLQGLTSSFHCSIEILNHYYIN